MHLGNVRIPAKVGAILALPMLMAALVGGIGLTTVFDLDRTTSELAQVSATKARLFAGAAENKTRLYQLALEAIVVPSLAPELLSDVESNAEELTASIAELRPLLTPAERADFATIEENAPKLIDVSPKALAAVEAGDIEGAKQLATSDGKAAFEALDVAFDALNDAGEAALEAAAAGAHGEAMLAAIVITAAFAAGLVIVTLAAIWLTRSQLVGPIRKLEQSMTRIAGGELETAVPGTARRDELGEMARAVEVFRSNGEKVRQLSEVERQSTALAASNAAENLAIADELTAVSSAAAHGLFGKRMRTDYSLPNLNTVSVTVNGLIETIERGLGETATVLSALAQTDLTRRVEGEYEGAFLRLKQDTNSVADRLAAIVGDLRQTSSSLKNATAEIAVGAEDLAARTTQQAASVEEASASMEQLGNTVEANSKRAVAARDAALQVMKTAEEGVRAMGDASGAMDRIRDSSGKISAVIGLIDDIAFQTNLLALNASVEAARAGDAGKGFAVVAVEVRRLAQSAATASSDVKALIETSANEVSNGGKLVAGATEQLTSMLADSRKSGEIVDAMAQETQRQAGSIAEMSAAIRQIDTMTQHNAALVEQTSAAIEQTRSQAEDLDRIVEVFTVAASERTMDAPMGGTRAAGGATGTAPNAPRRWRDEIAAKLRRGGVGRG